MKTKTIAFRRALLIALGLQTVVAGAMGISGAVSQLRAWQGDPLANASLVLLVLALFLTVGGGWLVARGARYQGHAA